MRTESSVALRLLSTQSTLLPRLSGVDMPGTPFLPGIMNIALVISGPTGSTPADPEDGSLTLIQACENLRQRSSSAALRPMNSFPGVKTYLSGDAFAASRVLILKELLDPFPIGGAIVSVPSADQLMILPLDRLTRLSQVPRLAAATRMAFAAATAPLTDQLLWFDGEQWSVMGVKFQGQILELSPPESFGEAIRRLAALAWLRTTPEA